MGAVGRCRQQESYPPFRHRRFVHGKLKHQRSGRLYYGIRGRGSLRHWISRRLRHGGLAAAARPPTDGGTLVIDLLGTGALSTCQLLFTGFGGWAGAGPTVRRLLRERQHPGFILAVSLRESAGASRLGLSRFPRRRAARCSNLSAATPAAPARQTLNHQASCRNEPFKLALFSRASDRLAIFASLRCDRNGGGFRWTGTGAAEMPDLRLAVRERYSTNARVQAGLRRTRRLPRRFKDRDKRCHSAETGLLTG